MMGNKQRLKMFDEYDLIFSKNKYIYLSKPQVSKKIKRRLHKRIRVECKNTLRDII